MLIIIQSILYTKKYKKKEGKALFFSFFGLDLFLDLGSLAETVTQVVQLRAANLALADGLDVGDPGRMQGEDLLTANTIADAANSDGLADAAMLAGNDSTLEHLDTLTGAVRDLYVHTNGVAHPNLGQLFLHVLAGQSLYQIHNNVLLIY